MPLDHQIADLLKAIAGSGAKPLRQESPARARRRHLAMTAGAVPGEHIVRVGFVEDIRVDGAVGLLKARVYRPTGDGPFPTVAFFHGGGFVVGDLETHDNICRALCRDAECVVVSVDYRLAPENPLPAAVDDAIAATKWVFDNVRALGGNGALAVAGDNAGGNLAALVAQHFRDAGIPLQAQLLIYPIMGDAASTWPSMSESGSGPLQGLGLIEWFEGHYSGSFVNGVDPRLDPLRANDLSRLPPALVVTAEFDALGDAGKTYVHLLSRAGSHAEHIVAPGMVHGFFHLDPWSEAASVFMRCSIGRFREILRRH